MSFIQVIEFESTREEDIRRLMDEWRDTTADERTATRTTLTRDRARPEHYVAIVRFPSYEEAMRNSKLPQTDKLARRMREICDGPLRFMDLDVVRDEDL
ncbi:quinol monooxygenase YgiN [Streptosporangium becharense]|uniref:Quinol monooxygenase YgiN n=1 Tax=Streptosporangium becharense TaxID=1816182 RepID=A0A7W9MHL6_9ACTN|nr:hypothetical protein [Streptosporangium becharense]MBB2912581.1 quinol monooxygenase YgiN [Streptosporangium becharense]MBB5820589.1 quinol monooxygenase YgiN [Streptosporangium becharense]